MISHSSLTIFSDFDGTLTLDEKVTTELHNLLSLIEKNSIELIIVTARPSSWAAFLVQYLPVKACIFEDGAGIVEKEENSKLKEIILTSSIIKEDIKLLKEYLTTTGIHLSPDSAYRSYSIGHALNYTIFDDQNIPTRIKSQFKEYRTKSFTYLTQKETSKANAIQYLLSQSNLKLNECLYFGDSINDASAFKLFPQSIGVSNLEKSLLKKDELPSTILKGKDNKSIYGVINFLKTYLKNQ